MHKFSFKSTGTVLSGYLERT